MSISYLLARLFTTNYLTTWSSECFAFLFRAPGAHLSFLTYELQLFCRLFWLHKKYTTGLKRTLIKSPLQIWETILGDAIMIRFTWTLTDGDISSCDENDNVCVSGGRGQKKVVCHKSKLTIFLGHSSTVNVTTASYWSILWFHFKGWPEIKVSFD